MARVLEATTKSDQPFEFLRSRFSEYLCCSMVRYLESDSPVWMVLNGSVVTAGFYSVRCRSNRRGDRSWDDFSGSCQAIDDSHMITKLE